MRLFESGALTATSLPQPVTLARRPASAAAPSAAGMLVTLPHSPRFAGTDIVARFIANTSGFDLGAFGMDVHYDSDALTYIEAKLVADGFNSPTVNAAEEGRVSLVTAAKTGEAVAGDALELLTLTFRVRPFSIMSCVAFVLLGKLLFRTVSGCVCKCVYVCSPPPPSLPSPCRGRADTHSLLCLLLLCLGTFCIHAGVRHSVLRPLFCFPNAPYRSSRLCPAASYPAYSPASCGTW